METYPSRSLYLDTVVKKAKLYPSHAVLFGQRKLTVSPAQKPQESPVANDVFFHILPDVNYHDLRTYGPLIAPAADMYAPLLIENDFDADAMRTIVDFHRAEPGFTHIAVLFDKIKRPSLYVVTKTDQGKFCVEPQHVGVMSEQDFYRHVQYPSTLEAHMRNSREVINRVFG